LPCGIKSNAQQLADFRFELRGVRRREMAIGDNSAEHCSTGITRDNGHQHLS
jgi:hypothetical protein